MAFWVEHPSISIPLYKSFWKIVDFIFPPTCVGCGYIGERMCMNCVKQIKEIELDNQIEQNNFGLDPLNENVRILSDQSLKKLYSFAYYNPPISSAIKKLKYDRDIGISEILANFLFELYNKNKMDIDMVIPVPLNKKRIKERGFNQSLLIAIPFSLMIKKQINKQALRRSKETQSQVGLNRHERFLNVSDAFTAEPTEVEGKNILLLDDVTTTGATLEACAIALKSAGANDIVALTVARAIPTQNGFSDYHLEAISA
ncbi:MAG TPA: ComF family protein [Anaerolineaceae bacterium]|nr:ComF family protein [Anaerolineaceae bacterium]